MGNIGLKCPGPGRVVEELVLGTEVCPRSEIISLETGVFYMLGRDRVSLKLRCALCNGRFMFNEFLRNNFLEAKTGQQTCSHESCVCLVWEGSRLCREHFLEWTPDIISVDHQKMKELQGLFLKAASERWFPQTRLMGELVQKNRSNGSVDVPASQAVCIDLETSLLSREVLHIGLANIEGKAQLDCLTEYGQGVVAPSLSSGPATNAKWKLDGEKKVRGYLTKDGTLKAGDVAERLRKIGICKDTIFVSWATCPFDLSHVRLVRIRGISRRPSRKREALFAPQ